MIDQGIYLFFDNEMAAQGEFSAPLAVVHLSDKFVREFKNLYMSCGSFDSLDDDEQISELRLLSERKFFEYCERAKLVLRVQNH
jgi:hypothetical protein